MCIIFLAYSCLAFCNFLLQLLLTSFKICIWCLKIFFSLFCVIKRSHDLYDWLKANCDKISCYEDTLNVKNWDHELYKNWQSDEVMYIISFKIIIILNRKYTNALK